MANTACATNNTVISSAFINKEGMEILSAMKAPRYVDYINILFGRVFSKEYLDNNSYTTLSDFTDDRSKISVNGNVVNLYNKVKEQLNEDIASNFYDSLPISTVNDILKIYRNWDLFVNYHNASNAFIKIAEDIKDENETKETFDKKGNEYNEFELVSSQLRTLFKFLPKADIITDSNGNTKIVEAINPIDGLPIRGDFENIFKLTLDALKGIKDESKFIQILTSDDLLRKIPELEFLFKILPLKDNGLSNLLDKQRLLFNDFYTTFSKDYIPVHASTRQESDVKGQLPEHFRYKSTKGNYDKILRQFTSDFSSNLEETEHLKIDNSEDDKNPERGGYGNIRLYSLPKKLQRIELTDNQLESLSIDDILDKYESYFDFYKILGIDFSDLSLLSSNKDKIDLIKILNHTLTIHDNISDRLERGDRIYNPVLDIQNRITLPNKIIPALRNQVKDIVKFEGHFSKVSATMVSKGASGENQSDISFSNALSIAANQISNSNSLKELYEKSYFKKLKYNPLHKGSWISTNIIGTRNQYAIENYSGHVIETEEDTDNSDTKSLSDRDKFISDYSNLLGWGIINTPQLESKAGYFALKFLDINGDAILPFPKENFDSGFISNTGEFFDQILSYLRGELDRIKQYSNIKNNTYNVPEAYGQLHIFKGIINDKQLKKLLSKEWDKNSSIIQEIKPNIEKYFQNQFDKLSSFIVKNDITSLITKSVLRNQGIKEELYNDSKDSIEDTLLRTFIANDFIHNVEFGIYISGDPLFYKDWHKRLGGLASTGTTPSNTNNLRLYFKGDSEVLYWNNYSLRGILNQYTEDPIQRRDNFDTFYSAVLAEDTINSDTNYHAVETVLDYMFSTKLNTGKEITSEQAMKELQIENLKIDVGDGQGYLNLDAHRELSIKQNTYRPQHDVSYKFESLIFKRDILNKELTESEEFMFNKLQNQILKTPNKYALPILKQTYYGTLANEGVELDAKVFDKFSLAPLLPSFAKKNPKLKSLLLAMAERQIHYVKYASGTKGYIRKVFSNINDLSNPKIELDELQSDLLKLQITPSKTEKTATKIPTQMVKLIYTNLFDKGNASDNVKNLRNKFLSRLNDIQTSNKDYVLNKLGFKTDDKGNITSWNKERIIDRIINQIDAQKLPSNLLEALKTDSDNNFVNTIESSGVYQLLVNYITGKLDSSLREFKVTGGDFVLLSESMFEEPLKYFRLNRDKTKILPLECRITLTKEYSKMLNIIDPKDNNKTIETIERLNQLLKDKDFVEKYEKELTIAFSRPPVQGPNSMGVGIIKEFFYPTAGNILQLPKEFMHQAGIDFDYDKEKVITPILSEEGVILSEKGIQKRLSELEKDYQELRDIYSYVGEYIEESNDYEDYTELKNNLLSTDSYSKLMGSIFNIKDIPAQLNKLEETSDLYSKYIDKKDKVEEYLDLKFKGRDVAINGLLESFVESLQQPELYSELILPNSFATVRQLALKNGEDIDNINTLPIGNSVYKYQENLKVFKMFNDAKALLGPFALENTFSQLIAPLNIKAHLDYDFDAKGNPKKSVNNLLLNNKERIINISSREDDNGQNKQHLNSEFINATVDSAKDPYFANFMLSFDNINTFMFLFSLNYPVQTIVDFTSSAIVRKYIDLKSKNPNLKPEQLASLTQKEVGIPYKNGLSIDQLLNIDKSLIGQDNQELIDNLKTLKDDDSLKSKEFEQQHKKLLLNFIAMEQHAKQYSMFKSLFKDDTTKVTSVFEIHSKRATRDDVIAKGMFSREDIEKIENKSTITAFRNQDVIENVLNQVFPILSKTEVADTLGTLFTESKPSLNSQQQRILSQIITNDYITAILYTFSEYKGQNFFNYAKNLIRKEKDKDGKYNITLLERIFKFRKNKEYSTLLEAFPVLGKIKGNPSLKPIKENPIYKGKHGFNLLLDIDPNIPLFEKEGYMNQFKQIIEGDFTTKSPETKEALTNFVKDFFIAGLLQSGFNKTGISYVEYIPIKFIQSILNPALDFYNFEMNAQGKNAFDFLSRFKDKFKYNNPNYFYFKPEDKKSIVQTSYLGKTLRILNFADDAYNGYNKEEELTVETSNEIKAVIPQNLVSGTEAFGTKQEASDKIKSFLGANPHSIDMIIHGFRTRTTRSVGEMEKYNIKVGDIIKHSGKSSDGSTKEVLAKVTAIYPKGTPEFESTWSKEGWTEEGIRAIQRYKNGAAAIEFELLNNKQEKAPTSLLVDLPKKSGKKEKYSILVSGTKEIEEREGYKITIPNQSSINYYLRKDNKTWVIDDVTTGSRFPVLASTAKQALQDLQDTINKEAQNPKNLEILKTTGLFANNVVSSINMDEEISTNPLDEYTNHSGGALGSDTDWDTIGRIYGFNNHNHYYIGDKSESNAPNGNVEVLEDSREFKEGKIEAAKAAQVTFGYRYTSMKDPRLVRNWSQVKNADAIFAIGTIVNVGQPLFPDQPNDTRTAKVIAVTGGTGYAVQMAINHGKPVYVFDQKRNVWTKNINGVWSTSTIPVLTKNYAGIGTRNINANGREAIKNVFLNTLANIKELTQEEQENLDKAGLKKGNCK